MLKNKSFVSVFHQFVLIFYFGANLCALPCSHFGWLKVLFCCRFYHCRCRCCWCCRRCCVISNSIYNSFREQQCENNHQRLCNTIQNGTHAHTCLHCKLQFNGDIMHDTIHSSNKRQLQMHAYTQTHTQTMSDVNALSTFHHTHAHWLNCCRRNLRRK